VALSSEIDGGLQPGLLEIAGVSKNFKSGFALFLASQYLNKYPEGMILFYDSEFGTPKQYFDTFKIDRSRVIHIPITDIEQLKHSSVNAIDQLERGQRVMIIIDSIGALASKKEVEDALEGKTTTDMTRAKSLKGYFRMVGNKSVIKDVPLIAINHVYKEIGTMYPKDVVSGGTGSYYSSDNLWIVGRRQQKDSSNELTGFDFVINVDKSRYIREKSQFPVSVTFEGGLQKWSGLFDEAVDLGLITSPTKGWYEYADKKLRRSDIEFSDDFWPAFLSETNFKDLIHRKYVLGQRREDVEDGN
jgi:RecA/RadA recombinase